MTLRNNRVPRLCNFTLCASLHSHRWIQTGVKIRKRLIWVKIYFFSRVTLTLVAAKTIGHFCYATASFVHHIVTICEFKLQSQSGNAQIGAKFVLTSVTLTFDLRLFMDITFVNCNNSWKCHDDTMTGTLWTRRSENDNTPQPLDQWTNSPFIGQQVGNKL